MLSEDFEIERFAAPVSFAAYEKVLLDYWQTGTKCIAKFQERIFFSCGVFFVFLGFFLSRFFSAYRADSEMRWALIGCLPDTAPKWFF